jgi:hypothetical protein
MVFSKRNRNRPVEVAGTKAQSGQTMVEAIVAVSLVVFAILGLFRLMSQSLGLTRVVRDQYVGNYLAAEGIELVKNMVDTNIQAGVAWNSGLESPDASYEIDYADTVGTIRAANSRKLRFDSASGFYGYNAGFPIETVFKRVITIAYPDCPAPTCFDHMRVSSVTEWITRGGGRFDVNVEDHLFNWNQ